MDQKKTVTATFVEVLPDRHVQGVEGIFECIIDIDFVQLLQERDFGRWRMSEVADDDELDAGQRLKATEAEIFRLQQLNARRRRRQVLARFSSTS